MERRRYFRARCPTAKGAERQNRILPWGGLCPWACVGLELNADTVEERLSQLAAAIETKVVPTLRMTFVDQDEGLAAVLGIPDSLQVSSGQQLPDSTVAFWKIAPPQLASIAQKRLMVQSLHAMTAPQKLSALFALATY